MNFLVGHLVYQKGVEKGNMIAWLQLITEKAVKAESQKIFIISFNAIVKVSFILTSVSYLHFFVCYFTFKSLEPFPIFHSHIRNYCNYFQNFSFKVERICNQILTKPLFLRDDFSKISLFFFLQILKFEDFCSGFFFQFICHREFSHFYFSKEIFYV